MSGLAASDEVQAMSTIFNRRTVDLAQGMNDTSKNVDWAGSRADVAGRRDEVKAEAPQQGALRHVASPLLHDASHV